MDVESRKKLLLTLGTVIAKQLEGFWGVVQFNIRNGKFVGGEVKETFIEEQEQK